MQRGTFEYWANEVMFLKQTKAKKTYLVAKNQLRHLLPYFGHRLVSEITYPDVLKYIAIEQLKKRTLNDDIKIFNQVMRLAFLSGERVHAMRVRKPDPKSGRGKVFTRSELARLMWYSRGNRDLCLQIRMAYRMGMRKTEVCAFEWDFINLKTGQMYLPPMAIKTKDTVDRCFYCSKAILRILRKRHEKSKSKYLFPSPRRPNRPILDNKKTWQKVKKRTGIKGRFHDLRHNTITNMQLSGTPDLMIKKMLGVSFKVMERYTHVPKYIAMLAVDPPKNDAA
jgi:integrase